MTQNARAVSKRPRSASLSDAAAQPRIEAQTSAESAGLSASRRAYGVLRRRILDLSLAPGERISELELAAELGLSRTPVHEAVQRLADEGLVEVRQRSGTFVARISVEGLDEAMLIRTALEAVVIERAAQRMDQAALLRLRTILAEQQDCLASDDYERFHLSDEAFHQALSEIAGLPRVWGAIQQAKTHLDRFRRLTLPLDGRMQAVLKEHTHIVDNLAPGKEGQAVQAMREHLSQLLPAIEMTRALRPSFFLLRSGT